MPLTLRSFVTLLAVVLLTPVLANATATGYTPGSFQVSPTGAATYTIPIAVPPGAAGMQPNLSLAYNSQGGNGLVGVGFSLQGLSAITHCPQTVDSESISKGVNFTYEDHYCLDGQHLMLVSGTYGYGGSEYRTELDSQTRIIAYGNAGNGPQYFIAKTKSGQTISYGGSADSRITTNNGNTSGTVMTWATNQITDTVGNYLTITYCQTYGLADCSGNPIPVNSGEYYPERIEYAGNTQQSTGPSTSVNFFYENRTDSFKGYVAGSQVANYERLTHVQTYEGSTLVRDYQLTYDNTSSSGRSRLATLTECDGSNNCLPATTFSWSQTTPGLSATPIPAGLTAPYNTNLQTIDVNGDGKTDMAYCTSTSTHWQIAFSNGTGYETPYDTGVPCGNNYLLAQPLDFNGDGLMDLLVPGPLGGTFTANDWYILQSTGSTFTVIDTKVANTGYASHPQVIDVNGDGRPDLVYVGANNDWMILWWSTDGFIPDPTDTGITSTNYIIASLQKMDFNGDGLMDLLVFDKNDSYLSILKSTASGSFGTLKLVPTPISYANANYVYPLDATGDGNSDIVVGNSLTSDTSFYVSMGAGTFFYGGHNIPGFGCSGVGAIDTSSLLPIDYYGDGMMGLLVPVAGYSFLSPSKMQCTLLQSPSNGFLLPLFV